LQAGNVYINTTPVTTPSAFNPAQWDLLGPQYNIFYVSYPYPQFDYYGFYSIGDKVYWAGNVYTALQPSQYIGHDAELQIGQILPTNVRNVFPNSGTEGIQVWGVGVSYSIPAGTLPTDATKWTDGDNRDQKLLMVCIDICLYHLHARIAPQNIPNLRVERYIGKQEDRAISVKKVTYPTYSALGWLQAAAEGDDITPAMPRVQPNSGMRIRHGGVPKNINSY